MVGSDNLLCFPFTFVVSFQDTRKGNKINTCEASQDKMTELGRRIWNENIPRLSAGSAQGTAPSARGETFLHIHGRDQTVPTPQPVHPHFSPHLCFPTSSSWKLAERQRVVGCGSPSLKTNAKKDFSRLQPFSPGMLDHFRTVCLVLPQTCGSNMLHL